MDGRLKPSRLRSEHCLQRDSHTTSDATVIPRMTRRLILPLAALALPLSLSFATVAAADAPPPSPNYSPHSGPPGTVVNVSGITLCERDGGTTGQIGMATLDQQQVGTTVPFAPPTASFTIPNVPNGDYYLGLVCGSGAQGMTFTVTGSTVAPAAEPVSVQPVYTG